MDSTQKIIKNGFRVHKPSKSQKSTKSQQSTLLTRPAPLRRKLRGLRQAPESCAIAQGPDGKIVFTRF
jgi:hypothetical protein